LRADYTHTIAIDAVLRRARSAGKHFLNCHVVSKLILQWIG